MERHRVCDHDEPCGCYGQGYAEASDPDEETVISGVPAHSPGPDEALSKSLSAQAFRDPTVWLLLAARAFGSVGSQMTIVHMLAFLFLAGYGEMQAAFAIGTAGLLGIGARPGIGLLSDILGREIVYTFSMAMTVAAIMVVLFFSADGVWWALVSFVALAGFSEGIGGLLIGAKAADLYPPRMLGTVMGLLFGLPDFRRVDDHFHFPDGPPDSPPAGATSEQLLVSGRGSFSGDCI